MRLVALLIGFSLLGYGLRTIYTSYDLFPELPLIGQILMFVVNLIWSIAAVVVLASTILGPLAAAIWVSPVSGLFRAAVYALLAFGAGIFLLNFYGVNIGAMLTTSAVLGVTIGLAMQPTLGSLFSGLAMSSDKTLSVGDAFWWEGRPVKVVEINWRHTVMRRGDNIYERIPNTRLASETLLYLPEDEPVALRVYISVHNSVPPQKVTDLLSNAFADFEHIDATRPLSVLPWKIQSEYSAIEYLIFAYARDYRDHFEIQGEVIRRAWYVLDRAGLSMAKNRLYREPAGLDPDILGLTERLFPDVSKSKITKLVNNMSWFRFAPTERIQLSTDFVGHALVILQGSAKSENGLFLNLLEHGESAREFLPTIVTHRIGEGQRVRILAGRLADDIGPMAEQIVGREVRFATNMNNLVSKLAQHIENTEKREKFIRDSHINLDSTFGPGTVSKLAPDVAGTVSCSPELRAESELLVAVFPSDLAQGLSDPA